MKSALKKIKRATFPTFFNTFVNQALRRGHKSVFWGNLMLTINKSAGFMKDPKFAAVFDSLKGSHTYDAYNTPQSIAWRLHTLVWAAQSAVKLPGDFVECGVFKGDFSWMITQMLDFGKVQKNYYLYDTYSGFSSKYSSAKDFPDRPELFESTNSFYQDPEMYNDVKKRFASMPNVKVVKGVIPEVFAEVIPEKIAWLHIDLNSPGPEIGALEALFDRVVPGGFVLFDDYGWINMRMLKEAEDEFMAKRGYTILELPTGQGLVIKRG